MIFSEKTFSPRCQLQIHDGVATLVFWLLFFMLKINDNDNNNNNNNNNTVLSIIISSYNESYILHISFFLAYNKLNCGSVFRFRGKGGQSMMSARHPSIRSSICTNGCPFDCLFLPSLKTNRT